MEEGSYIAETTTKTKFKIIYNKSSKLILVDKEKVTIDIDETDAPLTNDDIATAIINETLVEIQKEKPVKQDDTQMIEKQHSIEASSSQPAEEKDLDIKEKYKKIKHKNEEIKTKIYSQFLKQKPGNQNRLLSTFDYSKNK